MTKMTTRARRDRGERGAALILAMVFVFAIGLLLVALGRIATGALLTTNNLHSLRTTEGDAETATTIAMRYVRTTFDPAIYPGPAACLPPGFSIPSSDPGTNVPNPMVVYCTGNTPNTSGFTRVVDFYACAAGTPLSNCTVGNAALLLHAQVAFGDYNFAGLDSCNSTSNATCGVDMSIQSWDVTGADS